MHLWDEKKDNILACIHHERLQTAGLSNMAGR
jgi:hypothetical protein